jgi:hypothetical protein
MRHGEFRCQKEAAWVVTNILAGGTSQQLLAMCQMEVISPLCDLLKSQEPKFVAVILDALMTLLTSAKKHDYLERVTNAVEECGGLDILESMQNHDNQEIYEKVYHIIETFFAEVVSRIHRSFDCFLLSPSYWNISNDFRATTRLTLPAETWPTTASSPSRKPQNLRVAQRRVDTSARHR